MLCMRTTPATCSPIPHSTSFSVQDAVEENEMHAAKPRDGENEQRVAVVGAVRALNTFFMNCHQQQTHAAVRRY